MPSAGTTGRIIATLIIFSTLCVPSAAEEPVLRLDETFGILQRPGDRTDDRPRSRSI